MTVTLVVNKHVTIHSGPEDSGNHSTIPGGNVTWTPVDPGVCGMNPGPGLSLDAVVNPVAPGTTVVNISALDHPSGSVKTTPFTVVVTPGELDHFNPVADAPF